MYDFRRLKDFSINEIVAVNMISGPLTEENMTIFLPSVKIVETAIRFAMDNGLYQYPPMNIDRISEHIFASHKVLRRTLDEYITIEESKFDGFYGRQKIKTADQLFYQILIQCIHAYGRQSPDLIEYVVLTSMDEIFDEMAVEDEHDMLVWSLIIEYCNDKLRGRAYPFGKFLKDRGGSDARFKRFIEKNSWYQESEDFGELFGVDRERPKMHEIIGTTIKKMARKYQDYELMVVNNR